MPQMLPPFHVKKKKKKPLRRSFKEGRQLVRGGEMIRRITFDSTLSRRAAWIEPPTHDMHTPYEGGQGPYILFAVTWEKKTVGDDTERLTSWKQI